MLKLAILMAAGVTGQPITAGTETCGSGYGSPADWPAGEVERDLSEGFITEAGLADYGWEPGREA